MKPIEISNDLFCGRTDFCDAAISNGCEGFSCGECHRKWPTPEQYQKEYGVEISKDFPVWYRLADVGRYLPWSLKTYFEAIEVTDDGIDQIVCACAPFGRPPDDWRPQ